MIKYILSETKSSLSQKYTYVYYVGIFVLVLIANIAVIAFRTIYGANEGTYAYNLIEYATWSFIIPYYTCVVIADIAFGKQCPNPFIKDGLTRNLNRTQIYLSKLIVSILLGAVFALVAVVALFSITTLFQIKDGLMGWYSVSDFFSKMFIAVPLWIAGLSFGIMFFFIFKKKSQAYIAYFVLTLIVPRFVMFLAAEPYKIAVFRLIRTYTISQNMSLIPYLADPARNVPLTIGIGIVYAILAAIVGCVCYNKRQFE